MLTLSKLARGVSAAAIAGALMLSSPALAGDNPKVAASGDGFGARPMGL